MNYWIVKGHQRGGRNDFNAMLVPGTSGTWQTRKRPKQLAQDDRVFIWESSPGLRLIGLAEITNGDAGEDDGDQFYTLRYLTRPLKDTPRLADLRLIAELVNASFLKSGPAASILPLTAQQAQAVFTECARRNPEISTIWSDLKRNEDNLPDLDQIQSGLEGAAVLVTHLRRERNRKLIEQKKQSILSKFGKLDCEVCNFNFCQKYGSRGIEYCEVHHRIPISTIMGTMTTTLDDLAIVCSNCHRMLHVRPWLGVEELRMQLNPD